MVSGNWFLVANGVMATTSGFIKTFVIFDIIGLGRLAGLKSQTLSWCWDV